MRIYTNAQEMVEEVKRDLAEMGIVVRPATMQDKYVKGNPDYETKELQNYSYCLLNARSQDIPGVTQPWADAEFKERVTDPYLRAPDGSSGKRYGLSICTTGSWPTPTTSSCGTTTS